MAGRSGLWSSTSAVWHLAHLVPGMRNMKYKTLLEWDSIGQPSSQGALVFNQFLSMLLFLSYWKLHWFKCIIILLTSPVLGNGFNRQSTPLLASLAIPFCLIPFVRLTALRAQCDSPPTCSHLHISLHSWETEHVPGWGWLAHNAGLRWIALDYWLFNWHWITALGVGLQMRTWKTSYEGFPVFCNQHFCKFNAIIRKLLHKLPIKHIHTIKQEGKRFELLTTYSLRMFVRMFEL